MPVHRDSRPAAWPALLLAGAAYALAVAYLSWPLPTAAGSALVDPLRLPAAGGVWGRADLDLLVWILAWTSHALATQPLDLFQANIFHPAPDTLASSENLLGLAPLAAPLFWITQNPILTYNVTVLVVVWLAALCTFALVRDWTGSAAAAFLAGAAFALGPQLTGSWIRLHCSAVQFFPLVLLFAWRAARAPRARTLALLALVTALQLLAGIYVAFELAVLVAAFTPALVVEARRHGRSGGAPLAALAVGALALGVVAPAYLRVRASGTLPPLADALAHVTTTSPDPGAVLRWLLDDLTWPLAGLALVGLVAGPVPLHLRLALLLAAYLGFALGAGTRLPIVPGSELPSLYELTMRLVPGFAGMRSSSRFIVVALLALDLLAGLGAARALALVRARFADGGARCAAALTCVAALLLVALRSPVPPLPLVNVPLGGFAFAAHGWLRKHGDGGAVLDVPVMKSSMDGMALLATGRAMLGSTLHFLPLLNGYTGHPPAGSHLILTLAQRLPDHAAFAALCAIAPPRWIVVHGGLLHGDDAAAWGRAAGDLGLLPAATFGRDTVYDAGPACGRVSALTPATTGADGTRTFGGVPLAPLERSGVAVRLTGSPPERIAAGSFLWLWLEVRNDGSAALPGFAGMVPDTVMLQPRWRDARSGAIVASGEAVPLGVDLAPGETVRGQVPLVIPKAPGSYELEIGLVQQGRGFLAERFGDERFLLRGTVLVTPP